MISKFQSTVIPEKWKDALWPDLFRIFSGVFRRGLNGIKIGSEIAAFITSTSWLGILPTYANALHGEQLSIDDRCQNARRM